MQEKIGVDILVLDSTKKKVLAGKRKNAYMQGFYGLPGGRVNKTETLIFTVKRELLEETALIADKITYLGVVRDVQEHGTFIHFVFVVESYSGVLKNAEPDKCEGWEWYDIFHFPDNSIPGHIMAIELYKNPEEQYKELL